MKLYNKPSMSIDLITIEDTILTSSTVNVNEGTHNLGSTTIFDDDF